jgi:putative ABC transport system permease protein
LKPSGCTNVHLRLIRAIGATVPQRLRTDWRQEWEAELRFREQLLAEWENLTWRTRISLLWQTLGAFVDALWMQSHRWEDEMIQDLRFGARMLAKAPGLSLIVVMTLALGLGANAAIFSVVNALLFTPLPYPESERLVQLMQVNHARNDALMDIWSYPKFEIVRDQNRSFESVAGYSMIAATMTTNEEPERVVCEFVSSTYFPLLGVKAALGRTFSDEEDRTPGAHPVVVLGYGAWERSFGSDPKIIGRTRTMNGTLYTIIGVLPPGFRGQSGTVDLWFPMMMRGAQSLADRSVYSARILARLKPGLTPVAVQNDMNGLAVKMAAALPPEPGPKPPGWGQEGVKAISLKEARTNPELKSAFLILLAAAGFVLLVACANTANLLTARAASRRKEIAVRIALGAGRRRLIRQLLTESLLLSAISGVAGLFVAWWGIRLLTTLNDAGGKFWQGYTQALRLYSIELDGQVMLFIFGLSLLTGLLFGIAPALSASGGDVNEALKTGRSGGAGSFRSRRINPLGALVAAEIAMAVLLLTGAGLMIRSLLRLQTADHGFNTTGVTTFFLDSRGAPPTFMTELQQRVVALPGVQQVSLSGTAPLFNPNLGMVVQVQGKPESNDIAVAGAGVHIISPEYTSVYRVPIKRGRGLSHDDRAGGALVALISETAAQKFLPGEDPIGKQIHFLNDARLREIVGVVGDVKYSRLEDPPSPDIYLPNTQFDRMMGYLSVRGTIEKSALTAAVKREVKATNRGVPLSTIATMDEKFQQATAQARYGALLLGVFAALALLISQMGIYGVMSYAVAARTQEIGVRMALGARAANVLNLILKEGMILTAIGLTVGMILALALTRLLKAMLFGVEANDPATFIGATIALALVALLAYWIPARRATRVDPLIALRSE